MRMDFKIEQILKSPKEQWRKIASKGSSRTAFRDLKIDWDIYNTKDYLFTHDTIVASVATEEDGFTIKPACTNLVNANGNAWTNEVLLHCYKTFIGGENYLEHIQIPSMSKGKILDAIIRQVDHQGEQIYVVDILVATSRIHTDLIRRIEAGELSRMSMGATAKYVQCSVCGKIINTTKEEPLCEHLEHNIGTYVNYNGKKKFCSELCGAIDPKTKEYIPNSCTFIEASWVQNPAFAGAVLNYLIETPEIKAARQNRSELQSMFSASILPSLRVADKKGKMAIDLMKDLVRNERRANMVHEIFMDSL